jgi:rare lipoprotein A
MIGIMRLGGENIRHLAYVLCCIGVAMLVGCASAPTPAPESVGAEIGLASYYADRFHGRRTASGERYDRHAYTAAHRRLPFGTKVQVTRLDNGETVAVHINDRGPFVKGRVIDLSYAAAKRLGMLRRGVVRVKIVRVD